jgi:PadR family transcriptional regulator PadR
MPRRRGSSPQTQRLLDAMLAEPGRWWYGYELHRQLGLQSGTLYPILIRLADRGLLEARWEQPAQPGRPPRHLYRLTAAGALAARRQAQAVQAAPRGRRAAPEPG